MKAIYAGGQRIEVSMSGRFEGAPAVRLEAPELVELTPDSARMLALALIEHAADVAKRLNRGSGR